MSDRGQKERNRQPGHEVRDVDARRLFFAVLGLAAFVGMTLVLMTWTFDYFSRREEGRPSQATSLSAAAAQLPPEPRLQEAPLDEIRELRAHEEQVLGSYGWVDREKGIVRIPISKAMEIVVERAGKREP